MSLQKTLIELRKNHQKTITITKKITKKIKLHQNEIAKAIGVSPQRYNAWEKGKVRMPDQSELEKLAKYYKISVLNLIKQIMEE